MVHIDRERVDGLILVRDIAIPEQAAEHPKTCGVDQGQASSGYDYTAICAGFHQHQTTNPSAPGHLGHRSSLDLQASPTNKILGCPRGSNLSAASRI